MAKILDWLDRALMVIAVVALVAMTMLTTVSVLGRYFFSAPIPDDLVMSEMLMVFVAFLPLAYVQARREHVFVTIFTDWMTTKPKVVMETFGIIVGLVIFVVVACAMFTDFLDAYEVGAYVEGPLEIPESPARFVAFFGVAVFAVRLLFDAILSVQGLIRGTAVASRSEIEHALEQELK